MSKRFHLATAALLVLALVAAACSSGGDDETTETTAGSGAATATTAGSRTTAAATQNTAPQVSRLETVRERGTLICGSRDDLAGLGFLNSDGEYEGFDVDFCRVIAAGILGDANAVEIRPIVAADRFLALQSGDIDVLVRITSWTATRDGQLGADYLYTTLYDGQGFLVRKADNINSLEDLDGASICVTQGTTTELNLATVLGSRGIDFSPSYFATAAELQAAYISGTCSAYTSNSAAIGAYNATLRAAGDDGHKILSEVISKEPSGPVVPDGDTEWAQAVNWSAMAAVQAWEYGLNSSNVTTYAGNDGNINNFLGKDGFDPGLGLAPDFAVDIVSQVGNYREIWDRNLAPLELPIETSLGGYNRLWTDGGLHYVPPYR